VQTATTFSKNLVLLVTPEHMNLKPSQVSATAVRGNNSMGINELSSSVAGQRDGNVQVFHATGVEENLDGDMFFADITVDAVAVFVTLTTLAHGRFTDNAMIVRPPGARVGFVLTIPSPHNSTSAAWKAFSNSLRIEDVSTHQVQN
jgi:hypothetical protein